MTKNNKLHRNIISFILISALVISNLSLLFATTDTIYIDNSKDFIKFSKNASLDTYFEGKTVILNSDIDLSNIEDFQVATFAGIFDGGGNTISGISISREGSVQGLFRYLQEDAVIKNLNITGNIAPGGSQNTTGSLVGNNKGLIENCHFDGSVSGNNNIGGLVGINEASASISRSSVKENVTGDHFTGGIAGQNLGTILGSTNFAEVNTTISETPVDIDGVDWSQINSMENVQAYTDTGGIAGLSSGYLQDCVNRGPIGYKHIGYNVGGIVGRQSGYLSNCKNYSTVLGRKDVGGIVGQIEPYLMLLFSEDTLQKLNHELNVLDNIFTKSFENTKSNSKSISKELSNIGESIDDTRDIIQVLSRDTVDYIDDTAETINITASRVRYTLEEIIPILEDAEKLSDSLTQGLDHIEAGFDYLEITSDKMSDSLDESQEAMKDLRQAIRKGETAISSTENALSNMLGLLENQKTINSVIYELENGIRDIGESFEDAGDAIYTIYQSLSYKDPIDPGFNNDFHLVTHGLYDMAESLQSISPIFADLSKDIPTMISQGLSEISNNTQRDLDYMFGDLKDTSRQLDRTVKTLQNTFSKLEDSSKQSGKAFNRFSQGFDHFSDSSKQLTTINVSITSLIDSLIEKPDIALPNVSSDYRQSGEDLFATMDTISSQINLMSDKIEDAKTQFVNNIEAISDQVMVIFNLLIEAGEDRNTTDYIEDVSGDHIDDAELGIIYKNQNYGSISGSVNIGGIAGSMAVEFDLDPDDDVFKQGKRSLNFKYLTTAILKQCVNHGQVTAKKDYTGGITGRMDLGIISHCENYGNIKSEEGSYVGGIAGYANNLSNSYSLVEIINGGEWIGSIAGDTEGEVSNNYYVHDTIAAIDNISYSQKASPISYDQLLEVEGLPNAFSQLYLTFIIDGTIVEEIPFLYGDSFNLDLLPQIPAKDEHDQHWEEFDFTDMKFNKTIEAIYTALQTVLSSKLVEGEDQLPLFLVEGKFNKDAQLNVSPFEMQGVKLPLKHYEPLEAWNIEIDNGGQTNTPSSLRYHQPEAKKKISIWKSTETGWEKLDSSTNGSYIIFQMEGDSGTFCISEKNLPWISFIVSFLGLAISSLVIIYVFTRKSENK